MRLSLLYLLPLIMVVESTPIMTKQTLYQRNSRSEICANGFRVNNNFYTLEETRNITGIPADISVHWKTGNIFFTLISENMKMHLQVVHDGELETIKVAGLGQSSTVDNINDIIYLATDNGVYKYKDDGTLELFSALGEDVMYLAVSYNGQEMYIATWPQNRVQKITNDGEKLEPFPAIPNGHGLTIDPRNNIYFVASKTTYVLKINNKLPTKIRGLPNDKMTNVFVNSADEVYAMDENSNLYSIDAEGARAKHIGSFNVEGVNSFAIEKEDNVLIGIRGAILKYKYYETDPCEDFNTIYNPEKINGINTTDKPRKKGKRHNAKRRKAKKTTTTTPSATTEVEDDDENEE